MAQESERQDWLGVIARALSYLCVQNTSLKDKTIAQKAVFLDAVGLGKHEIAAMLESTPASVAELIRQSKSAKKLGRNDAKRTKKKR